MAIGIMPYFDDEHAPEPMPSYCRTCNHRDCAAIRKLRATICQLCKKGFIAGEGYYNTLEYGVVHAYCLEDRIAKDRETEERRECR